MSETIQSKETEEANHDQDAGDDADKVRMRFLLRAFASAAAQLAKCIRMRL